VLVAANGLNVSVKFGCGLFSTTSVRPVAAFELGDVALLEHAATARAVRPRTAIPATVRRSTEVLRNPEVLRSMVTP
jgi:hypothetical protein